VYVTAHSADDMPFPPRSRQSRGRDHRTTEQERADRGDEPRGHTARKVSFRSTQRQEKGWISGAIAPLWSTLSFYLRVSPLTGMRLAPSVLPTGKGRLSRGSSVQQSFRLKELHLRRLPPRLRGRRSLLLPSFEIHMLRHTPSTCPGGKRQQENCAHGESRRNLFRCCPFPSQPSRFASAAASVRGREQA